jgi:hypothetical protein
VLAVTTALVILDVDDASVHRYWSRHSFTSSVVAGVLVLLLTVLIVDRYIRIRQFRDQSRAIGAQAAVILAQAVRTKDAISGAKSDDDRDQAESELRTYAQMLLTSAPLLINAAVPRTFLEAGQRVAAQLSRALRATGDEQRKQAIARLDDGVARLREAADPLLQVLNLAQLTAVRSDDDSG